MSMCYCLKQADEKTIELLHRSPEKFESFFWEVEAPQEANNKPANFISKLFGFSESDQLAKPHQPEVDIKYDGLSEDIDKSWHGLHFLLTETDWSGNWPQSFLLSNKEILEGTDGGYGDAQAIRPNCLIEVDQFLSKINEDWLKKRYSPTKLKELEIYPMTWDDPGEFDYLYENFSRLKDFICDTVKHKLGIVMFLS